MSTSFILCENPVPGGVSIRIYQDADVVLGRVIAPEDEIDGSHTAAEADKDGAIGVHQALASAIELAESHNNQVAVIDPDGLWKEEWGELIRL
jgi:hypothetical protein